MTDQPVEIDYTNWRGERRKRIVRPRELVFASNQYHNEPQWLLNAVDVGTGRLKTFAMANIHSWVIPKPIAEDDTCSCCGTKQPERACPYQEEISGTTMTCHCCSKRHHECLMDI